MQRFITTLLLAVILLTFSGKAYAVTPDFPTCANPRGNVQASYDNGTHGIAGNSGTFTGRDTVYSTSSNQYTQCFCPDNGQGTQTNWLNATGLFQSDIAIYEHEGWIYITDGSNWGLSPDPYLAKNSDYTCASGSVSGASGSNSGSSNNTSSSSSTSPIQAVLSASTQAVSELASTGTISFILSLSVAGIVLTTGGIFLKKTSN